MRFSIREVAGVFAGLAFGLASLKLGGLVLMAFTSLVATGTLAAMTIAFVGRGLRQACSIGFLIGTAGYTALQILHPLAISENLYFSQIVTSSARRAVQDTFYQHKATGEIRELGDPSIPTISPRSIHTSTRSPWVVTRQPSTEDITASVNVMLALVFGYFGSKLASAVHRCHGQPEPQNSDESMSATR